MRRPGPERRPRIRPGMTGGLSRLPLPPASLSGAWDARVGVTTGATFTWADQSGNGNDATQSTAGRQPSVATNATLGTVLRFDGTADCLGVSGYTATAGPRTIYAVIDMTAQTGFRFLFDAQTGRLGAGFNASNQTVFDTVSRQGTDAVGSGLYVATWQHAGGSVSLWRNAVEDGGSPVASGAEVAIGGSVTLMANFAQSASYVAGDLAFLAVYDAAHNDAQRASVRAYIKQEWPGVPL